MLLRILSKTVCIFTLFLIFVGGMVTSTGSGLSVPDWPLSYGGLFPPMIGGIFYEHGHRMVAAIDGLLMVTLVILILKFEKRVWVRNLGIAAITAVILQGVLGGLTVLFFLPKPVSIGHAVLAQTYFILTLVIAYSQSLEREGRIAQNAPIPNKKVIIISLLVVVLIYIQLIFGAIMRHTHSGLAIPDFPTMGGFWLPPFNAEMLNQINVWRFYENLDLVSMGQVLIHFIHRLWAFIILTTVVFLNVTALRILNDKFLIRTIMLLNTILILQICLGIITVLSLKAPIITSLHVVTGAGSLGVSVLLLLRLSPLSLKDLKNL